MIFIVHPNNAKAMFLKFLIPYLIVRILILVLQAFLTDQARKERWPVSAASRPITAERRKIILQAWKVWGLRGRVQNEDEAQLLRQLNALFADLKPAVQRERAVFIELMEKIWEKDYLFVYFQRNCLTLHGVVNAICYWEAAGRSRRRIRDWEVPELGNGADALKALIRYLFEKYPVPPVVESIWFNWPTLMDRARILGYSAEKVHPDNSWLRFYFYLTAGGSIRKQTLIPLPFSKRLAALLPEVPPGYNMIDAYWWLVFVAAGGLKEKGMRVTMKNFDFPEIGFWQDFVRFLADTGKDLEAAEIEDLVELIRLVKFGKGELLTIEKVCDYSSILPELKLEGWTARRLLRYLRKETEVLFPEVEGLADVWSYTDAETARQYEVVRLKQSSALAEEGLDMGHCVGDGGYVEDSIQGFVSIWSLREKLPEDKIERLVTIALEGKCIVEAQGPCNEHPEPRAMQVLDAWAAAFGLQAQKVAA